MKSVPNPEYQDAPFEMTYVPEEAAKKLGPPLRFRWDDAKKVLRLMKAQNYDEILKLSIPSHIDVP